MFFLWTSKKRMFNKYIKINKYIKRTGDSRKTNKANKNDVEEHDT